MTLHVVSFATVHRSAFQNLKTNDRGISIRRRSSPQPPPCGEEERGEAVTDAGRASETELLAARAHQEVVKGLRTEWLSLTALFDEAITNHS